MASLSSVMVGNSLKLDLEYKKFWASPPIEKRNFTPEDVDKAIDFSKLVVRGGSNKNLDAFSYIPLLQESMEKNLGSGVESLHAHIMKTGFSHELFLSTFLVNVYCKCGMMEHAQRLFDEMPTRNVYTWTALMSGYVQIFNPESSIEVFKKMLEAETYPTNYTLSVILKACSSWSDIEMGKQIHGYIVKYSIDDDASTGNSLCTFYSKFHELDMAIKVFNGITEKDVISWTSAISACKENGNSPMGLHLFVQMIDEGFEPSALTLTNVIALCCTLRALDLASQVQSLCIKLGYGSDLSLENSFMYLYLTSGYISEAKKLFYRMKSVNLVAWNAMIAGHAEVTSKFQDAVSAYACGIDALKMLLQMNRSGIRPDSYTFSSVLTICSSLLALEQGEQVHAQAIKTGFLSDVVLGTSLVNMYSKCGGIHRASQAFAEMSTRTLISWTSMICAFAQHGYSSQALDLFEDMRSMGVKPNKITFVGVLSSCSQTGAVDQGLAYYKMMRDEYRISPVTDHISCLVHMLVRSGRIEQAFDFIKKVKMVPNENIWTMLIGGCKIHGKRELEFNGGDEWLQLKPQDSKMMRDEKVEKIRDWSWITVRDKVYYFKSNGQHDEVEFRVKDLMERSRKHECCEGTYSDDE